MCIQVLVIDRKTEIKQAHIIVKLIPTTATTYITCYVQNLKKKKVIHSPYSYYQRRTWSEVSQISPKFSQPQNRNC